MKHATPRDPALAALELIGRPWSGAIVAELLLCPGGARYGHLLKTIEGISDRVLTVRLGELAVAGLVERQVDAGPPVTVSYRLTGRGLALDKVIEAAETWAEWARSPAWSPR